MGRGGEIFAFILSERTNARINDMIIWQKKKRVKKIVLIKERLKVWTRVIAVVWRDSTHTSAFIVTAMNKNQNRNDTFILMCLVRSYQNFRFTPCDITTKKNKKSHVSFLS